MIDYQKYINALRKCAEEHKNDRTFTGHINVVALCQDTANLLEELEQEPALEKIRDEIEQHRRKTQNIDPYDLVGDCLDILDKYKAENEE